MHDRPAVPPPKRRFSIRRSQPLRDVDEGDRSMRHFALAWSSVIGIVGMFVSVLLAEKFGIGPPLSYLFWLGGPLAGYCVYRVSIAVTLGSAGAMEQIHNPSGKSTPPVREYSMPQSLAARGHYREAIDAYGDLVAVYPEDPEPYIRIARILRDQLGEFEEAVRWFKRARAEADLNVGRELLVSQEIIELYRHRLDAPARAIPELARLIERYPGHPATDGARCQLAELRDRHVDRLE